LATLRELLRGHERLVIIHTLTANAFNIKKTSSALGITRQALYRRAKKLKMDVHELRIITRESKSGTKQK